MAQKKILTFIFMFGIISYFVSIQLTASEFVLSQTEAEKKAEETVFPQKDYDNWLKFQNDPAKDDVGKIKNTINTYNILCYESWKQGVLFDFGFMFDLNDPDGNNDYEREKSLLSLLLNRWKDYDTHINSYDYTPQFEFDLRRITPAETDTGYVENILITPTAMLSFPDSPEKSEPSYWRMQEISMIESDGIWLIQKISGGFPAHGLDSEKTDFDTVANSIWSPIEVIETESEYFRLMRRDHQQGGSERTEKIYQQMMEKQPVLTLQDIKRQFKQEKIVRITRFDRCYAVVESHMPTIAPRFWFLDLTTGEKQRLNTQIYYTQLKEIKSPYEFIFQADGTNHINGDRQFPFLMVLECYQPGGKFQSSIIPMYLPLEESVTLSVKSHAEIIDYAVTINGLEVYFGPLKGFEGGFYAAYTDIPVTTTQYDKSKQRFLIIFKGTKIKEGLERRLNVDKKFIDNLVFQETGEDIRLILELKDLAKYYRCIKTHADPSSDIPCARFIFITQEDYESSKILY